MKRTILLTVVAALFMIGSRPVPAVSAPASGTTTLISVSSAGIQGNGESGFASLSNNGRFVAFESFSDNLAPGPIRQSAIFVRDLQTHQTVLITWGYDGSAADSFSSSPDISSNGRFVTYESNASNLVMNDTNQASDIFVHDRDTGGDGIFDEPGGVSTVRISVSSSGQQGSGGETGLINRVSITGDGRYMAFFSPFNNLVPNDHNNAEDVFVHDMQTGQTIRVSVTSDGTEGNKGSDTPDISADGRYVVFHSYASNLIVNDGNNFCDTDFDGIFDDNCPDIFLRDRDTDNDGVFDEAGAVSTTLISMLPNGIQGNNASDYFPRISSNGREIAFTSFASNLVNGDNNQTGDIFIHDRLTGGTGLVSISLSGVPGTGFSGSPSISSDGRFITFASQASDLAISDTNDKMDIFTRDLQTRKTVLASIHTNGTLANGHSNVPDISSTGSTVVFHSMATSLVDNDENGYGDVFLHEVDWPPVHFIFLPSIRNSP